MAYYMPQDVFDMAVATSVKLHVGNGIPVPELLDQIGRPYAKAYPGDDFYGELSDAVEKILKSFRSKLEDEQLPSAMTQMQFCLKNFHADGRRKKKRLFGGTLFTRSKEPVPNRVDRCVLNLIKFHAGTEHGLFPRAPAGWTL